VPGTAEAFIGAVPDSPCGLSPVRRSHSLDEVQHVADRVGIIRNGRLTDVDAVEQLRQDARRDVTILFAKPVDAGRFAALTACGWRAPTGASSTCPRWTRQWTPSPRLIRSSISFPSRPISRRSSSSCTRSAEMAVELTRRGLLDHPGRWPAGVSG
jgi:hypothetical protein